MREILFATLLLGCLITITSAKQGLFEFYDTYGRCWRCLPGSSCVRCSTIYVPFVGGPPDKWDRTCSQPTAETCATNPGVKFPHVDIGFYWICADDGVIAEAPCFCDRAFDMRTQQCVKIEDITSIACDQYANTEPHDCTSEGTRPPASTLVPVDTTTVTTVPGETTTPSFTTPLIPTVSNSPIYTTTGYATTPWIPTVSNSPIYTTTGYATTPWIPTVSNSPTEPTTTKSEYSTTVTELTTTVNGGTTTVNGGTTTINGGTTTVNGSPPTTGTPRTTENAGPGASMQPITTTTVASKTTPAPCVCVLWWPCWCNPCWNMPCHSCNGCIMG